jgi:Tfp pilus assembly protein PilN
MNTRNLIPAQRLSVKRRQCAVRRWIFIDGVYLAILVAIGAICSASLFNKAAPIESPQIEADFERSTAELVDLRKEFATLKTNLESMQDVTNSPDWSILLGALSQTLGDDVVLNGVDCTKETSGPKGASVDPLPQTFRLSGIGRSQQSVTRFVLCLERLQFFSRVQLVQTTPQSLHGGEYPGFQLICSLPPIDKEHP